MPINQIQRIGSPEMTPSPEKIPASPEQDFEVTREQSPVEREGAVVDDVAHNLPLATPQVIDQPQPTPRQIDERFELVENILEEELGDVYFNLSPADQQKFKVKGEETATKIVGVLSKPKVKVNRIILLIRSWLSVIPGINKFFLEQMVKIKTDKIIDSTLRRK